MELPHEAELRAAIKATAWIGKLQPLELNLIRKVVARVADIALEHRMQLSPDEQIGLMMDLGMVHATGHPLALFSLLVSSNEDLTHDVLGINKFIDRSTGQLREGFKPRHLARMQ